jgi:hypothetical protein
MVMVDTYIYTYIHIQGLRSDSAVAGAVAGIVKILSEIISMPLAIACL